MRIIAHKNITYDYYNFLKENLYNPKITGVAFDVLMTVDKKIIIYTPYGNYISSVNTLQSNSLDNLKKTDIITLEEALKHFSNSNKKIILNLLPILSPPINDENISNVNKINFEYVNEVNKIIKNFPSLQFYICSAYDNLVFQIKRLNQKNKVGFVLTNMSTTYIDVDFYAFTINMLERKIIEQQLRLNKEVMIYILNCDDINIIMQKINNELGDSSTIKNKFNEIYFINNYPEIFWNLFN